MTRISLFVHDLSLNPIVRAAPLARALQHSGFEVEIIGFVSRESVYEPYKDLFDYRVLPLRRTNGLALARLARGEIIYAFKPLWTSFVPALIASGFGRRKPLFLDVEDDELWFDYKGPRRLLIDHVIRGWRLSSPKFKWLIHPLTKLCKQVTVSSRTLQRRYGGEIILQGPDERMFDPDRADLSRDNCRQALGLPLEDVLILFAGHPTNYKGLDVIIEAMIRLDDCKCSLVLAGAAEHPMFISAKRLLGERCKLLGNLPHSEMPKLLAAVDVVPVPQKQVGYTEAQIPAKMIEAMAMRKAIVASRVSDLPHILGEHQQEQRGWVIQPGSSIELEQAIRAIISNPDEAQARGYRSRQYYLAEASVVANSAKLTRILGNYSAHHR